MKLGTGGTTTHVPPPGSDPLGACYTPAEVATLHGVSMSAVWRAIREGRLKAWARANVYLIPAAEVTAWSPTHGKGKRTDLLPPAEPTTP